MRTSLSDAVYSDSGSVFLFEYPNDVLAAQPSLTRYPFGNQSDI